MARRVFWAVLTFLVATSLVMSADDDTAKKKKKTRSAAGKLKSLSAKEGTITLSTQMGTQDRTFTIDSKSKVIIVVAGEQKEIPGKDVFKSPDLKIGKAVQLLYVVDENVVTQISVGPKKKKKKTND